MNLPKVIADLVKAQNDFESVAYANCFSESAVVFDEGKTHIGRKEIEHWIDNANNRYRATMEPISFEEKETESILKAKVSGSFEGSPIVLNYHLEIIEGLIQKLKISGLMGMADLAISFIFKTLRPELDRECPIVPLLKICNPKKEGLCIKTITTTTMVSRSTMTMNCLAG
ncbi:hypothetical protein [Pedobacter sp. SYSU D00535]|uniref:hypothetical protein n=1 Tax=Pedobacter sp. SYSU D00535 TaxID=2810308 RepID=UPI001F60A8DC|nr:hypothetical protein [Pedobacter sp. SYSU D00535]